jgi:argininosuccinate lyase
VAFAEAHAAVGRVVAYAARSGRSLRALSAAEWRRFSPKFGASVAKLLDPRRSVARKRSAGSTNPAQVARALRRWRAALR